MGRRLRRWSSRRAPRYWHARRIRSRCGRRSHPSLSRTGSPASVPGTGWSDRSHSDHRHLLASDGGIADYELASILWLVANRFGDLLFLWTETQHAPGSKREIEESKMGLGFRTDIGLRVAALL